QLVLGGEHYNHKPINVALDGYFNSVFAHYSDKVKRENFSKGKIVIGNDVVISNGARIMSGVTIGDGAVVGAGTLVNKDVPPYAIVGGVPAKVIKYRFQPEQIESLRQIRWWDFELEFLLNNLDWILTLNEDADKFIGHFSGNENRYFDSEGKYFVSESENNQDVSLTGYVKDGQFFKLNENEHLQTYLGQLKSNHLFLDDKLI
ncbi:MAG: CatB-related O-acetyltransferase, partial [Planctomycetes bacterium]|nr:CatB-related O-acetyltransferase [Planctomycetota bacterium]